MAAFLLCRCFVGESRGDGFHFGPERFQLLVDILQRFPEFRLTVNPYFRSDVYSHFLTALVHIGDDFFVIAYPFPFRALMFDLFDGDQCQKLAERQVEGAVISEPEG